MPLEAVIVECSSSSHQQLLDARLAGPSGRTKIRPLGLDRDRPPTDQVLATLGNQSLNLPLALVAFGFVLREKHHAGAKTADLWQGST